MSYIFISYSHKDKDYVHKLQAALQDEGFDVWIDDRIDFGTTWPKVIQQHLDDCAAFIVVMTEDAYESVWVQNEVTRAQRKKKPFFALLLKGEPWLSVEAIQYEDVTGNKLPSKKFYDSLAFTIAREEKATREKAERDVAEKVARERLERETSERTAREKLEREATEKLAQQKAQAAQTLGTMAAFQSNNYYSLSGEGAACGGTAAKPTSCTSATYLQMLEAGIYPLGQNNALRAQYIELWAANANAFPEDIKQAHAEITAQP